MRKIILIIILLGFAHCNTIDNKSYTYTDFISEVNNIKFQQYKIFEKADKKAVSFNVVNDIECFFEFSKSSEILEQVIIKNSPDSYVYYETYNNGLYSEAKGSPILAYFLEKTEDGVIVEVYSFCLNERQHLSVSHNLSNNLNRINYEKSLTPYICTYNFFVTNEKIDNGIVLYLKPNLMGIKDYNGLTDSVNLKKSIDKMMTVSE